jgi:hypothetical protein
MSQHWKTSIEFIWDKKVLEIMGVKIEEEEKFRDFLLDSTRSIIKKSIENEDEIFYLIKVEPIDP